MAASSAGQVAQSRTRASGAWLWRRATPDDRAAVAAFLAVGAAASAFYLVIGHRLWFRNDEWDFLTDRTVGNLRSLFKSHFGHWSTLPILVYRFLWFAVGLRSYVPYQVLIVALHLLVAWLIRCVMRRAGVSPWIATAAAVVYVLFGRGQQDIVWAFQITQVGSLAFGLTHLLLADHDGPFDRRDRLGLAAGFAGLLCSGVAVSMVIVVGIATLIRRGRKIAALHTVPLGLLYVIWFSTMARDAYSASGTTWPGKAKFVVATGLNAFRGMSAFRGGQWLVIALLLLGLVLAWSKFTRTEWSELAAAPFALLIGSGVFLTITALGRAGMPGATYRSRYIDLALAMVLPALAVAADAIVRRRRVFAIPVFAVLLVGIPSNLQSISDYTASQQTPNRQYRHTLLSLPRNPLAATAPPSLQPLPGIAIGWLRAGANSGRIPGPGAVSPAETATDALRLSLRRATATGPSAANCRLVTAPLTVHLRTKETMNVKRGTIRAVPAAGPFADTLPATYAKGVVLTPSVPEITFRVLPAAAGPTRVCGPSDIF